MKRKLIIALFGLLVGITLFYMPPQLRLLPFSQSERLIVLAICVALVTCWTALLTKTTGRAVNASILFSVMSCIGYQVVVPLYRFRVGMTFRLVSWDRFLPEVCISILAAGALGFVLGKATLKLKA
ncbi:hypothetical protein NZD89_24955 [Alicyclobacillus fastidiosus]|uniref:Uncharacterized protein n=1 Tax=Alicyclobacillus fastidiosus TaxID=392011 RepID=A0ABY6ZFE5_9BACL|nr:hypothetical protein [Alicyclobacillus fastidiosus]WAH41455.1 hypothetical protein NZD89_24955 [Alicyclobacillus fastidiosus]